MGRQLATKIYHNDGDRDDDDDNDVDDEDDDDDDDDDDNDKDDDDDDDVREGAVRQLGNTCPQPLRCTATILLLPQRINIFLWPNFAVAKKIRLFLSLNFAVDTKIKHISMPQFCSCHKD